MSLLPRLRASSSSLLLLLPLTSVACGAPDAPRDGVSEDVVARSAPSLALATELGVPNAREPLPGLLTAGQPTPEQLEALIEAGYASLVSLRPAEEPGTGWEEGFVASRDVSFARVPVGGAAGLTREAVEELDRLLDAAAGEPTVLYCGSANRVGAMLALRAYWLEGASSSEAIALGRAAGLQGLEPAVAALMAGEGPTGS